MVSVFCKIIELVENSANDNEVLPITKIKDKNTLKIICLSNSSIYFINVIIFTIEY